MANLKFNIRDCFIAPFIKIVRSHGFDYNGNRTCVIRYFLLLFLLFTFIFISFKAEAAPRFKDSAPRLLNYFLKWELLDEEVKELAKWDIVVLDRENQINNPEKIKQLRKLNPNIIILAYIASEETETRIPKNYNPDIYQLRKKMRKEIRDGWWLTTPQGRHVNRWPNTWMLNASAGAPEVQGERWIDYLSSFVVNEILSTGLWDGIFYDNTWDSIVPLTHKNLDLNQDGERDDEQKANDGWKRGMVELFQMTREKYGKPVLLFGNGGYAFKELNGVLIENFPQNGWVESMQLYLDTVARGFSPAFGLINANTANSGKQDYQKMRFGYASSLLGDGYFSYDFGDLRHEQTWWYDEYDVKLGKSLTPPFLQFKQGLLRRDFEKGIAVVNSASLAGDVELEGDFELLRGVQDKIANNGLIVNSLRIDGFDGRILRRPLQELTGHLFKNGAFVRVLNTKGDQARNGFFSFLEQFDGGARLIVSNLDNRGSEEVILIEDNIIKIFSKAFNRLRSEFEPYPEESSGAFDTAIGDLDGDGLKEIVVINKNGPLSIRAFNLRGDLIAESGVYDVTARSLAVGNINHAKGDEIIIGLDSEVVVFGSSGKIISGPFEPYPGYKGGIDVAAGDIHGDGIAEIITAPKKGKDPAYILDGRNFVFYTSFNLPPVRAQKPRSIKAVDFDEDGITEVAVIE